MSPQHEDHLAYILSNTESLLTAKYKKGVKEYGTHLKNDYTIRELLDNALDEAIDQVTYLLTMKQKLEDENIA